MKRLFILVIIGLTIVWSSITHATITINFDDVIGSRTDITNRYVALGVTLNAIDNPFPLFGPYPAPSTLPTILGGVTTWTQGFPSATSAPQVAVAAPIPPSTQYGDGGILISFTFDVNYVSLIGNDAGFFGGSDNESVTLTAYNSLGNKIGQVYSTTDLPNPNNYDQTPASISMSGIRYVAFNYTDSFNGFYSIDDLQFDTSSVIPEPATIFLIGSGLIGLTGLRRKLRR